MEDKPTVLFGILNWGLGHASRSIPIIKYLQSIGYQVVICSDGHVLDFLHKELTDITYEFLPGYNMRYSHKSMAVSMVLQSPKILKTYLKEHKVFQELASKYKPLFCISDNRFGCRVKGIPSYFIGHQWNILGLTQKKHVVASRVNQFFIRKFDALLVPDDPVLNITGKLTQDIEHKSYDMGILSRFEKDQQISAPIVYKAVAILSGPEPKRSQLEEKLCAYFEACPSDQFALIRGTEAASVHKIPANVVVFNIAEKMKILEFIQQSRVLLCRSGYSSIMDYLTLDLKRIIFIPTAGQTEQEYLAERMRVFHGFESINEHECTIHNIEKIVDNVIDLEATERTKIDIDTSYFERVMERVIEEQVDSKA